MQYAVVILDLSKLSESQWSDLWTQSADYVIKIKKEQRQAVIDALESISNEIYE